MVSSTQTSSKILFPVVKYIREKVKALYGRDIQLKRICGPILARANKAWLDVILTFGPYLEHVEGQDKLNFGMLLGLSLICFIFTY